MEKILYFSCFQGEEWFKWEHAWASPLGAARQRLSFYGSGLTSGVRGFGARPPPLGALGVFVRLGLHLGPESIGRPVPALRSGLSRASASTRPGSPVFSFFFSSSSSSPCFRPRRHRFSTIHVLTSTTHHLVSASSRPRPSA